MKRFLMAAIVLCMVVICFAAVGCRANNPITTTAGTTTPSITTLASSTSDSLGVTTSLVTTAAVTSAAITTASVTTAGNPTTSSSGNTDDQPTQGDDTLRFLFLGNSLMFYNDMPNIFNNMAKSAGKDVYVASVTEGSATISKFASVSTTIGAQTKRLLTNSKWDYVIIEPSRRITPYDTTVLNGEIAAAKKIQDLAKAAGAEVLLYSVWGNNSGSLKVYEQTDDVTTVGKETKNISRVAHAKFMYEVAEKVSEALGNVTIIKTGYGFENFIAENPDINLYHSDKTHPSLEGSFLAAATVYGTVFNERSVDSGYTQGIASAQKLLEAADKTVIDGVIPDLTEKEVEDTTSDGVLDVLVIGTNLIDDYTFVEVFGNIVNAEKGVTVNPKYITSSNFVFNALVDPDGDMGVRSTLDAGAWDVIILQLSRRCTPSSSDIEEKELEALKSIYGVLSAETEKIYIMTLNGSENPTIFTTQGGDTNYSDTGRKETATAKEITEYMADLATTWADEVGCKAILYGNAYLEYSQNRTKPGVGYLQAACLYNAFFGEEISAECTETNGLDANTAAILRGYAAKHCLDK